MMGSPGLKEPPLPNAHFPSLRDLARVLGHTFGYSETPREGLIGLTPVDLKMEY